VYASGTTTITANGSSIIVGNNLVAEQRVAQSFQVSTGHFSEFTVTFIANSGTPSGTVTYELRHNNAGDPGTIITTGTFTPTASTGNTVNVTTLPILDDSTTYWLVLRSTNAQDVGNGWQVQTSSAGNSTYADGEFKLSTNGGSSWTGDTRDMQSSYTTIDSTPTPTPTPDMHLLYELPDGKSGELVYSVTAGELALIVLAVAILGMLIYMAIKEKK